MDRVLRFGLYIIVTISVFSCDATSPADVTAKMTIDHETTRCETNLAACSIKFDETTLADHLRGPKGDRGEKGEPGLPGLAGVCNCAPIPRYERPATTMSLEDLFAMCGQDEECLSSTTMPTPRETDTKSKALISCKHAPAGSTNGTYFVRAEDPFEVYCDMNRNLSCLIHSVALKDTEIINYIKHDNNKPFWISAKNHSEGEKFDINKFYGYDMNKIQWLQSHSTFVTQKIRYHCFNSLVHPDEEKALRLLSWTDSLIGPQPTNLTPAHYTIVFDECKDSTLLDWKHADIMITGSPRRLPIIDFYIQDIRKEDQRIYLELRELCFG
ncbi:collagen alpha chain-like [Pectinophora gossypiella]|uniref:collagen alpha chain-like n=1 Tax=Pectinophora gossypiella TaxID=13191 RepID=UPI00214EFF4A|nr:collagen alpha chain-like [Pectinophora gossypiella]